MSYRFADSLRAVRSATPRVRPAYTRNTEYFVTTDVNMHSNVVLCFSCSCERTACNFPDAKLGRKLCLYAG